MANSLIRLKIEKTLAYNSRVLIPGEEITLDAKIADIMVERNLATILGEEQEQIVEDELDKMTLEELKEYAAEADIKLEGVTKKADILAKIRKGM